MVREDADDAMVEWLNEHIHIKNTFLDFNSHDFNIWEVFLNYSSPVAVYRWAQLKYSSMLIIFISLFHLTCERSTLLYPLGFKSRGSLAINIRNEIYKQITVEAGDCVWFDNTADSLDKNLNRSIDILASYVHRLH